MTDAFTKYTELAAIENKNSETVTKCIFDQWIANHGAPRQIVTDQGTEFCNQILKELATLFNITKITTSSYHAQANSSAESFNRQIIKFMKTALHNNTLDWELKLAACKLAYNSSVHSSTLRTPFFLTYLHEPNLPFFDTDHPKKFYKNTIASATFKTLEDLYLQIQKTLVAKNEYECRRDKSTKTIINFQAGDKVLLSQKEITKPGTNHKFEEAWKGPYTIIRIKRNNNVLLDVGGNKTAAAHINRIKPWRS